MIFPVLRHQYDFRHKTFNEVSVTHFGTYETIIDMSLSLLVSIGIENVPAF